MANAGEEIKFEISGPGPYGFRLYGGDGEPFVVAKLRPKSKAQKAGIVEGDVIIGINGQTCQNISHTVAMGLIEKSADVLHLTVIRGGKKDGHTISTAYHAVGSGLRPVSPRVVVEISSQSSSSLPSYLTSDLHESHVESSPGVFYRKEEQTVSEGDTQRKVTTETKTEDVGGTKVTKVTKIIETSSSGTADVPSEKQASIFRVQHVAGLQKGVWSPGSSLTTKDRSQVQVDRPVLNGFSSAESRKENVKPSAFPPRTQTKLANTTNAPATAAVKSSSGFRISKPPAKPWVWQPSYKPVVVSKPPPEFQLDVIDQSALPLKSLENDQSEDSQRSRGDPELPSSLVRILTQESSDFEAAKRKKKTFADSSFYDDPKHRYPTIEEQIKMARKVALSLMAPSNVTARGQRMFMKRKEKATKWEIEYPGEEREFSEDQEGGELYYNPTPWKTAKVESHPQHQPAEILRPWEKPEAYSSRNKFEAPAPAPAPPPFPPSNAFAHTLATFADKCDQEEASVAAAAHPPSKKLNKTGPLAPQVCFNLAKDIRKEKGKGGAMFAKRAARANDPTDDTSPNIDFMRKINEDYEPRPEQLRPEPVVRAAPEDDQPPVNRLKEMIEKTRPLIGAWDGTDYGYVNTSFQHLNNYNQKNYEPSTGYRVEQTSFSASSRSTGGFHPVPFNTQSQNLPETGGVSEF